MQGLTSDEVRIRQKQYGSNTLAEQARAHPVRIFFSQFTDIMVLILLAAAVISWLLGEYADAVTIAVIVVLNVVLGFVQEYRTEQTLLALRNMTAPTAKVRRDGRLMTLPAEQLVPDDIISLEAGDCVPADALILTAAQLYAEESILTGESDAVEKHAHTAKDPAPDHAARRGVLPVGGQLNYETPRACEMIARPRCFRNGQYIDPTALRPCRDRSDPPDGQTASCRG